MRSSNLRRCALAGVLVGLCLTTVWGFVQIGGLAPDWRVFYSAGAVVAHGGSPYDHPTLFHEEELASSIKPPLKAAGVFINPPLVALLLRGATVFSLWISFALATLVGVALIVLSLRWWLRTWNAREKWALAGLLSFPAFYGLVLGQFDALLFASVTLACVLVRRRPTLAGLCMIAIFFKPHLLWPLLFLLGAYGGRRFMVSSAATVLVGAFAEELFLPGSTSQFVHGLLDFTKNLGAQKDVVGVPGYFQASAPKLMLTGVGVALVLAFTWYAWARRPSLEIAIPLGLTVWLLMSPYAHTNDLLLILPLSLALLRAHPGRLGELILVGLVVLPSASALQVFPLSPLPPLLLLLTVLGWDLIATGRSVRNASLFPHHGVDLPGKLKTRSAQAD
jgi:Glycosyltransferase family 87